MDARGACCSGRKRKAQRGRWSERSEDGRARIRVEMAGQGNMIVMVVERANVEVRRHYVKAMLDVPWSSPPSHCAGGVHSRWRLHLCILFIQQMS